MIKIWFKNQVKYDYLPKKKFFEKKYPLLKGPNSRHYRENLADNPPPPSLNNKCKFQNLKSKLNTVVVSINFCCCFFVICMSVVSNCSSNSSSSSQLSNLLKQKGNKKKLQINKSNFSKNKQVALISICFQFLELIVY